MLRRKTGAERLAIASRLSGGSSTRCGNAAFSSPEGAVRLVAVEVAGNMPYDVAPDGRFLFTALAAAEDGQAAGSAPIIVVLNALAGLRR